MTESFILPIAFLIIGLIISLTKKKMKVRIEKCSFKDYWYKNLIGKRYTVVESDKKNYRVIECFCKKSDITTCEYCESKDKTNAGFYIEKNDCVIVNLK